MMNGHLITLEGIDNAGKTTICPILQSALERRGHVVSVTRELRTEIGALTLSKYLRGSPVLKTLLFAADRIERQDTHVTAAQQRGEIVLADRWVHSSLAYRWAEVVPEERAEITDFVLKVNRPCLSPTRSYFIDIDPEVGHARETSNHVIDIALLGRVQERYLELVSEGELLRIDGLNNIDTVVSTILADLELSGF